jgi:hypothetical protein
MSTPNGSIDVKSSPLPDDVMPRTPFVSPVSVVLPVTGSTMKMEPASKIEPPSSSPSAFVPISGTKTFPEITKDVIEGKKATRLDWHNSSIYIFLAGGYLQLHKAEGTTHQLLVSDGDMLASDWIVL